MTNGLQPASTVDRDQALRGKFSALMLVTCFFGVAVYFHLCHLNSHYYHTWTWRHLPGWPTYLMFGAASVPFFAGQFLETRRTNAIPWALTLVMVSMFCFMLAGAAAQRSPPSFDHIAAVQMSWDVGYFKDAERLQGMTVHQWLARYPRLLGHFDLHPRTKPPGVLLYETAMIDLFGPERQAAMIAGLTEGFVATFSVLGTYAFIKSFTQDRRAAFFGASFFALCPGPVWFFPMFDQCYPIVTAAVTLLWATAHPEGSPAVLGRSGVDLCGGNGHYLFADRAGLFLGGIRLAEETRLPGLPSIPSGHAYRGFRCIFCCILCGVVGGNGIQSHRHVPGVSAPAGCFMGLAGERFRGRAAAPSQNHSRRSL